MEKLIWDIVSGELSPGGLLEREVDLADRFDVSRGVARECVRALEERGLVTVRHGRGAAVNPSEDWNSFDPQVLAALIAGPERDRFLDEAMACRRLGEIEAAALAAERASKDDLERLWAAFAHLDACAERARAHPASADLFDQSDLDFHRAVVQASGNLMLGQIIEPVHRAFTQTKPYGSDHDYERTQVEHRRILCAIDAHDPAGARQAMSDHLDSLAEALRGGRRRNRRRETIRR
jgi:GntR family transcriptional repressor for pyruvate dehydrogenase complex